MRVKDRSKHSLYVKMYEAARGKNDKGSTMKALFNGVMAVNTLPYQNSYTKEQIEEGIPLIDEVYQLIQQATPRQIMQAFPIHKEFDGEKSGSKDYFYTREYLKKIPLDKPIGENVHEFLWEYYNWNVMMIDNIRYTYHSQQERLKEEEKMKQFNKDLDEKSQEIKEVNDLIDKAADNITRLCKEIEEIGDKYKENIDQKFSLFGFIIRKKLKKLFIEMETHNYLLDVFMDKCKDIMAEYASVQGWDDYIEGLRQIDVDKANEAIMFRNLLLNKCYSAKFN